MITIDTDREVLKNTYKQYIYCVKKKKIANKMPLEIRCDISKNANAAIEVLSNSNSTTDSIRKALTYGKNTYGQYCRIIKGTYDVQTSWLKEKMEGLVDLMADHEARFVHLLRMKYKGIADISLGKFYKSPQNIATICNDKSWSILQNYLLGILKDNEDNKKKKKAPICVYVTPSGSKYHKADCQYCKGKKLKEIYFETAVSAGYSACSCIVPLSKQQIVTGSADNSKNKTLYMTAFIDESLRSNPWYKYDHSLDQQQLSYSYIICRGRLQSEKEISAENILYRRAALSDSKTKHVEHGAFDAISRVLMLLAFNLNYHSNVIIYTDNNTAAKQWKTSPANNGLSKLFSDIQVVQIPRKKNRRADAAGRERAFADVPKELMVEVDKMISDGKRAAAESDFVHHYFKDPENDIPKLINSLMEIAGTDLPQNTISNASGTDDKAMVIDELINAIKEKQINEDSTDTPIDPEPPVNADESIISKFLSRFSLLSKFFTRVHCAGGTVA